MSRLPLQPPPHILPGLLPPMSGSVTVQDFTSIIFLLKQRIDETQRDLRSNANLNVQPQTDTDAIMFRLFNKTIVDLAAFMRIKPTEVAVAMRNASLNKMLNKSPIKSSAPSLPAKLGSTSTNPNLSKHTTPTIVPKISKIPTNTTTMINDRFRNIIKPMNNNIKSEPNINASSTSTSNNTSTTAQPQQKPQVSKHLNDADDEDVVFLECVPLSNNLPPQIQKNTSVSNNCAKNEPSTPNNAQTIVSKPNSCKPYGQSTTVQPQQLNVVHHETLKNVVNKKQTFQNRISSTSVGCLNGQMDNAQNTASNKPIISNSTTEITRNNQPKTIPHSYHHSHVVSKTAPTNAPSSSSSTNSSVCAGKQINNTQKNVVSSCSKTIKIHNDSSVARPDPPFLGFKIRHIRDSVPDRVSNTNKSAFTKIETKNIKSAQILEHPRTSRSSTSNIKQTVIYGPVQSPTVTSFTYEPHPDLDMYDLDFDVQDGEIRDVTLPEFHPISFYKCRPVSPSPLDQDPEPSGPDSDSDSEFVPYGRRSKSKKAKKSRKVPQMETKNEPKRKNTKRNKKAKRN